MIWPRNNSQPIRQDLQKIIKKKRLEKKKSRKKMTQRRQHDGRFSDKYSDVTRTTTDDSGASFLGYSDQEAGELLLQLLLQLLSLCITIKAK